MLLASMKTEAASHPFHSNHFVHPISCDLASLPSCTALVLGRVPRRVAYNLGNFLPIVATPERNLREALAKTRRDREVSEPRLSQIVV